MTQLEIIEWVDDEEDLEDPNYLWHIAHQLSHLSSLKNLNAFSLDAWLSPQAVEVVAHLLQSFTGLQSLKLGHPFMEDNVELCSVIRCLTKLTLLDLMFEFPDERLRLAPFAELKNIQSLGLGQPCIFNADGDFMFPSLTNLVHVDLAALYGSDAQIKRYFEVVSDICDFAHVCFVGYSSSSIQSSFTCCGTLSIATYVHVMVDEVHSAGVLKASIPAFNRQQFRVR